MSDNKLLYRDLGKRNKGIYWEYLSAYSFLEAITPGTDYQVSLFLGYGENEPNCHCHNIGVLEDTKNLIIKEFNEGKYTEKFFVDLDLEYRKKLPIVIKLCSEDLEKCSNEKLADIFDKIWRYMSLSTKPMLLALKTQYLKSFFEDELFKVTKKEKDTKEFIEDVALLLTSTKITLVQKEEEMMLNFIKDYLDSKKSFDEFCEKNITKLNQLVDETGWFHMEYINDPWDIKKYKETIWKRIQNNEEAILPSVRREKVKVLQKEFFAKYNDKRLENLAYMMQEMSFILDATKAVVVEIRYRALPLYDEIAKRIGVDRRGLLQLIPTEILGLLKGEEKANLKLIDERLKARAILLKDGVINVYQGKIASDLAEKLIEKTESQTKYAKGIIAFPGVIKGKATVIHNVSDHHKFKEGDILISHDVSTEITALLQKASGIVTDQGGIICHAAIVAREFKTPCIVGTQNATAIFKDGDIVEVDANSGIVKKL
jgi:phosphohistidine swiveling domain-containing protein